MMFLCCQVLTEVNALNIFRVNDRYQSDFSCVRPRGRYGPKGVTPPPITDVNVLVIILVKYGEQLACDSVSSI